MEEFQVTSNDTSYTLCISDMKAGGVKDFKEILEKALSDIEAVCNTVENCNTSKARKFLASIKNSESGTIRLICTACKAIQKQFSEQTGCHVLFHAYLHT